MVISEKLIVCTVGGKMREEKLSRVTTSWTLTTGPLKGCSEKAHTSRLRSGYLRIFLGAQKAEFEIEDAAFDMKLIYGATSRESCDTMAIV